MLLNFFYIAVAIFSLGFCIFIHELGHFLAARRRGLKVERFSIGFGPRLFGWTRGGVDYRLSAIPFGGYVALPQLADMGRLEGDEERNADPQLPPISYADKMIVSVMGAVFNLILAFVLSLILWMVGREVVASTQVHSVAADVVNSENRIVPGPAMQAGIRPGDTIVSVDGSRARDWMHLQNLVMTGVRRDAAGQPLVTLGVLRDGREVSMDITPVLATSEAIRTIGVAPASRLQVISVRSGMPAEAAGLQGGDVLVSLNGEEVVSAAFLHAFLANHAGGPVAVGVERQGLPLTLSITPTLQEGRNLFGFVFNYDFDASLVRVHLNPLEQIGVMADTLRRTLRALLHRGSDVKVRNMSGPVGITHGLTHMARSGWNDLLWFLAFINVNLAILNLLPIPVLDGGHMMFATISRVSGRRLPRRFMESVQVSFVFLLLGFVLYVTFFDVGRVGRDIGLITDPDPIPLEETVEEK